AEQEHRRLGLDIDVDALLLDVDVPRHRFADIVERIGHAGAAGVPDADADALDRLAAVLDDLVDARHGGIGEAHDLHGHVSTTLLLVTENIADPGPAYHQFSAICASSDMRLGSQGGSNTMLTVTSWMPSTERAASSTQ